MKLVLFFIVFSTSIFAQTIEGKWKTIDTKTQKELSIIEIYKKDNQFYGKLLKISNVLSSHADCEKCFAKIKNNSLIGKNVIVKMQKQDNLYKGKLIDPFSDKSYTCVIKMLSNSTLEINAYSVLPLFGRTQIWRKIN
ncbi:MAG: DUF2147 domain-containing protein [Flavobacterium sp.]|jgi:uncharacterized protein (DUF2147 family)|uniref:DUF2147 domain-containing protein n=1 Tax=Flavobacterium sp. TaxID=239 RepID=UPI0035295420